MSTPRHRGSYGRVWKARDKRTDQIVAIKHMPNVFRSQHEARMAYREVTVLDAVRGHENFVRLTQSIIPRGKKDNVRVISVLHSIFHRECIW
jgi:serine/threonine protein kinase